MKNKAWQVDDNYNGHGCVVFATCENHALQLGIDKLHDSCLEDLRCAHKPEFDQFYNKGYVPNKVLLDHGWWLTCSGIGCDAEIILEELETQPFYRNNKCYCSKECYTYGVEYVAKQSEKFEAFKKKVIRLRPDLHFYKFKGGYPLIGCYAYFEFDNGKGKGSVQKERGKELEWFVIKVHESNWQEYNQKIKDKKQNEILNTITII